MKKQLVALVTAAMVSLPSVAGAAAMSAGTTAIVMSSVAAGGAYHQSRSNQDERNDTVTQQVRYPEKVSEVIDWKKRGWLFCPRRDSDPKGCKDDMGNVVPWVEWMKDYAGPDSRMLNMIVTNKSGVIVSYGVL